ncbi:MAG TPA: NADH-quinone oxidoreductase subunit N [Roseiflexaceae bacterium]|nr:NADH-quinone oxidoreductase subunit N [Roseiflexaceae bacterium]
MLLALALLVLGTDVLERWGSDEASQLERGKAAGQLTVIGLGFVFVVGLVQSKFLFTIPEPTPDTNPVLFYLITLGRNLQAGGPGGEPILGAFATDNLTMIARLTFIGAAFLTTLLALEYRPSGNPGEFYALILFSTAGMNLMSAASELIMAYVSLELSSISLYILAGYFRNDKLSSEAGIKYFLFGALSSGILLYGMSLAYGFTASINRAAGGQPIIGTLFSEIAKAGTAAPGGSDLLTLAMIFVVAGMGYKVAVVPFHSWSPDVYQGAPTPITAFISTASKTAGFILLFRALAAAFPSIAGTPALTGFNGWTSLLALIALATMVVGNLSALPQKNAKRLLAYSSIGHAGFILLALILWNSASPADKALSSSSLLYYLIVYTATNLGAFGALAVVREALGGDDMADLNGLWRRNIGLALMLTVLVLSLAGVPPLSGFWAKFFVFMAGYQAGASERLGTGTVWLVGTAVAMTIVSLYYYLGFLRAMWMNEPKSLDPVPTPPAMNATLIVATVLVVLLGLFPNVIWNILSSATLVAGR